jgi:LPXTG-motif cell wall-anchored protein
MKRKNIIFLVLILAVMVGVFLYFRNKKKQDQYLGNMLTSQLNRLG